MLNQVWPKGMTFCFYFFIFLPSWLAKYDIFWLTLWKQFTNREPKDSRN